MKEEIKLKKKVKKEKPDEEDKKEKKVKEKTNNIIIRGKSSFLFFKDEVFKDMQQKGIKM